MKSLTKTIVDKIYNDLVYRSDVSCSLDGIDQDVAKGIREKWERIVAYQIRAAYRRGEI